MEDMDIDELDEMVTAGVSSRTHASDRIRGIFHSTGTRPPIHIDQIEEALLQLILHVQDLKLEVVELDGRLLVVDLEGLELGGFAFQTGGGRSVGRCGACGAATSGASRGGAVATSGVGRGGVAATSGVGRGGAAATNGAGGGSAAAIGSKLAGKRIVTTIAKGVQIMEAKRKRTNPG
jgi:hypothetical protein